MISFWPITQHQPQSARLNTWLGVIYKSVPRLSSVLISEMQIVSFHKPWQLLDSSLKLQPSFSLILFQFFKLIIPTMDPKWRSKGKLIKQGECSSPGRVERWLFTTWVKEDNCLESRILVVVYLNILEGLDQFVQHSVGYPADLRFRTVPVDHTAITCRHRAYQSVVVLKGTDRGKRHVDPWGGVLVWRE